MSEAWRVSVGGDPTGGWMVDIHDGENHGVYSPEAADAEEAERLARDAHTAAHHPDQAEPFSDTSDNGFVGEISDPVETLPAESYAASEVGPSYDPVALNPMDTAMPGGEVDTIIGGAPEPLPLPEPPTEA